MRSTLPINYFNLSLSFYLPAQRVFAFDLVNLRFGRWIVKTKPKTVKPYQRLK